MNNKNNNDEIHALCIITFNASLITLTPRVEWVSFGTFSMKLVVVFYFSFDFDVVLHTGV